MTPALDTKVVEKNREEIYYNVITIVLETISNFRLHMCGGFHSLTLNFVKVHRQRPHTFRHDKYNYCYRPFEKATMEIKGLILSSHSVRHHI